MNVKNSQENPYLANGVDEIPITPEWKNEQQVAQFLCQIGQVEKRCPASKSELIQNMGIKIHLRNPKMFIASMPVKGNRQTQGIVHGGANAVLAETAGSIAANYYAPVGKSAVGVNIYITHHRPGTGTRIYAIAQPVQIGNTLGHYEIRLYNQQGQITASGTHTIAYVETTKIAEKQQNINKPSNQ